MTPTIAHIIRHLEHIAPPIYQEDYDNAGLITGNPSDPVCGVLTCLDVTEAVLDEAEALGCNLVVAHHPIVFKGLKRLTGATYVERVVIQAIRRNIAIYAIHTNLDNMYFQGVNTRFAEQLQLQHTRVLSPQAAWRHVRIFLPEHTLPALQAALAESPTAELLHTLPTSGQQVVCEIRTDTAHQKALQHLLESIVPNAHAIASWQPALQPHPHIGAGIIGELPQPLSANAFLEMLQARMQTPCIRHTDLPEKEIQRVAICGGSGSFLLSKAIAQGADAYVSADFKYHEFFDADHKILIADIGHFESEQFTINLLQEIILQKFSTFAVYCTKVKTNPIHYH